MNIVCISQVYWPDTTTMAQHLTDLCVVLAKRGHQVSVYTSQHNYEHPEITYPKYETHKGVHIHRLANTGFGKKHKIGRLMDVLSFNVLSTLNMFSLKKKTCDLVIGMSTPPLLAYFGLHITRIKKIPFLFWAMDLQPELSIVAGYLQKDSAVAHSMQKKGDYIFRYSDKIIVLDKYMEEHIYNRLGCKRDHIDIIPVWPVVEDIYKGRREDNPYRIKQGFGDRIVIMYSGNHAVIHPLSTLLQAAVNLKNDPRFLFVHIGGGVRLKEVLEYKEKYRLDNVVTLPYEPRENIHNSLGSADLQVVVLGNGCVGYTHPNKVYGAMFIKKPILYIGPDHSHITDILDHCPGNIYVSHEESDLLTQKILVFAEMNESEREDIGKRNRTYAETYLHPDILLEKMAESIEAVSL